MIEIYRNYFFPLKNIFKKTTQENLLHIWTVHLLNTPLASTMHQFVKTRRTNIKRQIRNQHTYFANSELRHFSRTSREANWITKHSNSHSNPLTLVTRNKCVFQHGVRPWLSLSLSFSLFTKVERR